MTERDDEIDHEWRVGETTSERLRQRVAERMTASESEGK